MRLMFVVATAVSGFLALSLAFYQMTRKTYPGFGLWTSGVSLLGVGYLFVCLRGYIPDAVSILVVNVAFFMGMVLHLAGMRRFLGLTPLSRLWYALSGVLVADAAALYYGYNSESWRNLNLSIAVAAPHFAMAFLILGQPVRRNSMFYVVIGSLMGLGGVMILGRAIWSLAVPTFNALLDSPVQFIFFVSVVVLQLGENLPFMMLNSERLEKELLEAEAGLRSAVDELQRALDEIKTLSGFLPICASCKKIRDDRGYWQAVEQFIEEHSQAQFSHGICPDCLRKLYPEFAEGILAGKSGKN